MDSEGNSKFSRLPLEFWNGSYKTTKLLVSVKIVQVTLLS